jgi:hypothetical protein
MNTCLRAYIHSCVEFNKIFGDLGLCVLVCVRVCVRVCAGIGIRTRYSCAHTFRDAHVQVLSCLCACKSTAKSLQ